MSYRENELSAWGEQRGKDGHCLLSLCAREVVPYGTNKNNIEKLLTERDF